LLINLDYICRYCLYMLFVLCLTGDGQMGYVLVEWKKLKTQFPEFQETLVNLESLTLETAAKRWGGQSYGRFNPGADQYGRTTILPEVFADEAGDILDENHSPTWWGVDNFRIYYSNTSPSAVTIPGWKTILQGGNPQQIGVTPEDVIIGLAGFAIPDPSILISKFKLEIGDKIHVKIDIEEMHMYEQPALIFEEGYRIPPETYFKLRGFFEADGFQRVIPLGFLLYRRKDFLIHE